ncbi:MAG TPA: DUF2244 domain-containing protein [Limnobacter sp.]|uniref:DUF2244 domain-containing protein n=1 Tax=Limnobacter sp. TaxID=2003368 RepID=UPI002ED9E3B1
MIPEDSSPRVEHAVSKPAVDLVESGQSERWVFRKNCSLSPRQLLAWYAAICSSTLVVATGFLIAGYWIVLPFAGLELLLVGVAFLVYARHATDFEMIELAPYQLRLVFADGARRTEISLSPQWARLDYNGRYKAPLTISHKGQHVKIGKFIAEKDKPALHKELRAALARAACAV